MGDGEQLKEVSDIGTVFEDGGFLFELAVDIVQVPAHLQVRVAKTMEGFQSITIAACTSLISREYDNKRMGLTLLHIPSRQLQTQIDQPNQQ